MESKDAGFATCGGLEGMTLWDFRAFRDKVVGYTLQADRVHGLKARGPGFNTTSFGCCGGGSAVRYASDVRRCWCVPLSAPVHAPYMG